MGIIIAIILAVLFGNGAVVLFNHMPADWFGVSKSEESSKGNDKLADNDEVIFPNKLMQADNAGQQRMASSPWKYIFVSIFLVIGVYLALTTSVKFEIASLFVIAVMLEMAIADQKYRIVPDQLQLLLALTTIGFIGYNDKWWEPIAGAGIGLALGLAELGIGLAIYKKVAIGGADIKFFTVIGLVAGRRGVLAIFILTTLLFAIESAYMLAARRIKRTDGLALMPAATLATTIYLLFLYNTIDVIQF